MQEVVLTGSGWCCHWAVSLELPHDGPGATKFNVYMLGTVFDTYGYQGDTHNIIRSNCNHGYTCTFRFQNNDICHCEVKTLQDNQCQLTQQMLQQPQS